MAIQEIEKLGLGEVLGSLLSAVVEAQQYSIRSTLEFVQQVGIVTEGEQDRLRTVIFRHTKLDENQQPAEFTVELPLLAMVPIPRLAVKSAKLDFSYDILETVSRREQDRDQPVRKELAGRPLLAPFASEPAVLRGHILRTKRTEPDTPRSVDISIDLEQQALPLGLERMFDLAELSITERSGERRDV